MKTRAPPDRRSTVKQCVGACSASFQVTDADRAFYDKVSPVIGGKKINIPEPSLCPECRQQRRMVWRNERKLYRAKSALSGNPMLSMYYPDSDVRVFEQKEWWSDQWNGLDYGQSFDFSRPFFEQFLELKKRVPHINLCNDSESINCDYVNQTTHLKNCYLVYDTDFCEQTYYTHVGKRSFRCMDGYRIFDCKNCYECVDCKNSYQLNFSQDCEDCSESFFLKDCKGVRNSFGCINLRQKQYCFLNEQLTKEDYEKRLNDLQLQTFSGRKNAAAIVEDFFREFPRKADHNIQVEHCTGDYLTHCKDSFDCFDAENLQDCRYVTNNSEGSKDCMDYDVWGVHAELLYECCTVGEDAFNVLFSMFCWGNVRDLMYCDYCMHSRNLFGCVGLKRNQYCILNKQYTKDEYEALVPRIIDHMHKMGEWGEFFPANIPPFSYQETLAQDFYPLKKEQAQSKGFRWHDIEAPLLKVDRIIPAEKLPETIDQIPDDILNWAIECVLTKKPFKIIPQELAFYREFQIPIPRLHPDERHRQRMALRNPRKLWERNCDKCGRDILTSYSLDRPAIGSEESDIFDHSKSVQIAQARREKVYCEECYLKEVY